MSLDINKLKRLIKRSLSVNSDIQKLSQVLEQYTFFKNIKQKITTEKYVELINEISVVDFPKYSKVFNYGDMGRKFYIILQGSVFIITPDNKSFSFEGEEDTYINYSFLENEEDKEIYERMCQQNRGMKIVSVLKQDNSFGEVALRSNVPRTATVICREACVLIAINVDVYHSIVEEYHSALYEEDISFLLRFPFLKGWEKSHITNLLRYIRRVQCFGNQIIYNVGDPVEKIYLIKHGEFEIYQTDRVSFRIEDEQQDLDEADELNLTKKRNKKEHLCRSAILSDYCSFGIEEIGTQQEKRQNKVICVSSEALLYVIDKKQYFNVMQDRGLIKDLAVENQTKQVWRDKHGEERKILNEFFSPKNSNLNSSSNKFYNMDSLQLNDENITQSKVKASKRLSLQLTNKRSAQQFQQQLQQNQQQQEYHNFSQSSISHIQNEENQLLHTNSIRKIPLWLSNQKQQQQNSSTRLPQVGSLVETNNSKMHDVNFSNPVSSNLSQAKLSYKGQSSILLSSQTKIQDNSPKSNLQSTRSLTAQRQIRASQVDAELNERPLLDCYVNAMMKKTMLSTQMKKQKVFTQKEFFAAIRQTQQKRRYCTPKEEGKNYIYSYHKQKENNSQQQKLHPNNKDIPGSILGELLQDQKVKQDLHNIKQTFLHEQRMSLKNTQLHRKLTANYDL